MSEQTVPRSSLAALLREERYQRQLLRPDAHVNARVIVLSSLAIMATAPNDILLLRGSSVLAALWVARVVFIAITAGVMWRLPRETRPIRLRMAYAGWAVASALMVAFINVSRVPVGEVIGPIAGDCAFIMILFFAFRGPICHRVVGAGIATLAFFPTVWSPRANLTMAARTTLTVVALLLNVVGFVSARAFEEQRQKRFDAEQLERDARRQLMRKVVELDEAKKRAEKMGHARMAFLAAMSHEFRTPMNAVLGFSDLLLGMHLDAKAQEYTESIRDSARGLLVLLNDILDFAKIDADKLVLATIAFDLKSLISSVTTMMEPLVAERSISVELQVDPEVPAFVMGDDVRLRQVLVNLLSNAIKFTSQGVVRLHVSARARDTEAQHEITFSVQDSGIGMTKDVIARLFQPFEQGDQGVTRRHQGTGLGLAISKRIVNAMGGDIQVESEPGRGSTFTFTITLAEAQPSEMPTEQRRSRPHAALSILVVDDHPINRRVATAMLERMGHDADVVDSGANAVLAATQKDYDIIFMDLHMPQMSGFEATRQILSKLEGCRLPRVVAMTASVFEEDREACRNAGMRDFVAKPIDRAQLGAVLTQVANDRVVLEVPPAPFADALAKLRELEGTTEPGFVSSLLRDFLQDTPKHFDRMHEALGAKNSKGVYFEAHTVKATSGSLGLVEMASLCARIEMSAKAEDWVSLAKSIEELRSEFRRNEPILVDEINNGEEVSQRS